MTVAIVESEVAAGAREAVELLGGMKRFVSTGEKVVIKPNICTGKDSASGAVTDPEVVAEVCRMVDECGGEAVVAESPIYPYKSSRVFARAGYGDFEKRFGFPLIDLDSAEAREIRIPAGKVIDHSIVPTLVLTCDRLINVPVMKTHLQTVVTMGLKNLKGVVVGRQKHIIHIAGLDQGIVDLNTVVSSDLTILDGIVGMEGFAGPTNGRPVAMGVVVAGDNVVETDAVGIRIMGGDPGRVDHVRMAAEQGLGSIDGFEILGADLGEVAVARDLPRMPGVNRFIVTDVVTRAWNLAANQLARLSGGERVRRRAELGELVIDEDECDGCRLCLPACPVEALSFEDGLVLDRPACIRCFCCAEVCPKGALSKRF